MDIWRRLKELRVAERLSQGDIQRRTGLLLTYVSRVEGGHTVPSLSTLERFANALGMEPYQVLFCGDGKPAEAKTQKQDALSEPRKKLVRTFNGMSNLDRKLLPSIASMMAKP